MRKTCFSRFIVVTVIVITTMGIVIITIITIRHCRVGLPRTLAQGSLPRPLAPALPLALNRIARPSNPPGFAVWASASCTRGRPYVLL